MSELFIVTWTVPEFDGIYQVFIEKHSKILCYGN